MRSPVWNTWELSRARVACFGVALVVVALITVVVGLAARDKSTDRSFLGQLVQGTDRRLSTSKCQALIWTVVAIFGFVEVFLERLWFGTSVADNSVPVNLLLAMGFSATTMAAAKGITVSYVANGLVNKSDPSATPAQPAVPPGTWPTRRGGLITDDDGIPDLTKIQMLAFTSIAVVVYFVHLVLQSQEPAQLIDIEPSLMVLMGLSQGAYLGKKLTTTEAPKVTGISPPFGKPGDPIRLTGVNFGETQNGSVILLDQSPVPEVISWSDTRVEFKWPADRSPGVWTPGDRVVVVVTVNGRDAQCPVLFTCKAP
jgi:hypothetical protein